MNYIRHLHAFYQLIKNDDKLSSMHIALYLALFQYWNYNRFQNPFSISRADLMQLSKIKTKNSYHKCLKELHQKRLIIYHSSSSKFIKAKVSMIKLGLRMADEKFNQLDLFNPPKNPHHSINIDTGDGTENDTGGSVIKKTAVLKSIPAGYQNKDSNGINNDTRMVSKTILLIKHKIVNSSSICYKNTVSEIFEKNKKIQEQISYLKNELSGKKIGAVGTSIAARLPTANRSTIQQASAEKIPLNPETKIQDARSEKMNPDLIEVQAFFLQKNFPDHEAQRFYYYNQGRNWMLNNHIPITDWQAMAHKWMIIQKEKNILNTKQTNNGKNDNKQTANSAFLRDAKNDFYASAGRSAGNHS